MLNLILIIIGKSFSKLAQLFNLGAGSTWPGHIALILNENFIRDVLSKSNIKTILIAGTNGKTTTSKLIRTGLEENGRVVFQNQSGANLLNGIASALIQHCSIIGKLNQDFAVFEIDEDVLHHALKDIKPDYLVFLNLFRDQLDRYGEVNIIADHWKNALVGLSKETSLFLNADDPQVAYLGNKISITNNQKVLYFGLQNFQFHTKKIQQAADSIYCPKCFNKLTFDAFAFSHLGNWYCNKCGLKRPEVQIEEFSIYPLPGFYNKYNVLAASAVLKNIGLTDEQIRSAFKEFKPAFGRQEIVKYKNRNIQIFLSKNPTSFNQSYQIIQELGGKNLLLVLNDRIPDGRDVSWIWDVDLPDLNKFKQVLVSGDRVYDMALRIKYELGIMNYESRVKAFEELDKAIENGIKSLEENETLYILPTYSAMLEVRKIITGKKIL